MRGGSSAIAAAALAAVAILASCDPGPGEIVSHTEPPPAPWTYMSIPDLEKTEVRPLWLDVRIRVVEETTMKHVADEAARLQALAQWRIELLKRERREVPPEAFREPALWGSLVLASRRDAFDEGGRILDQIEKNCAGCHERLGVTAAP